MGCAIRCSLSGIPIYFYDNAIGCDRGVIGGERKGQRQIVLEDT